MLISWFQQNLPHRNLGVILHAVLSETIGERHASACRYKKRDTGGLTPNATRFNPVSSFAPRK